MKKISEIFIAGGIVTILLAFLHPQLAHLRNLHDKINIDELVIGIIFLIIGFILR